MQTPLVSVVMPVYNGQPYLVDAVASIIEQSFSDWQLICVNDGSTDNSGACLDRFASCEPRVRVLHQPNSGIVAALNNGIAVARSPLICRMDCDDIAVPNRLQEQAAYMQAHPDCVVLGGAILEIDADNDPLQASVLPREHDAILCNLLHRRTGHFHPTTMIRAAAFHAVGGYRRRFQWVEDHDLWLRIADYGRLANLPEIALYYRQHSGSVCWQRAERQRALMNDLLTEAYRARKQTVPEGVITAPSMVRSSAGPGKWARAAAKGGFRAAALKHLAKLNWSDARLGYKARMNLEVAMRLLAAGCGRSTAACGGRLPPRFPQWHARLAADGLAGATSRVA